MIGTRNPRSRHKLISYDDIQCDDESSKLQKERSSRSTRANLKDVDYGIWMNVNAFEVYEE